MFVEDCYKLGYIHKAYGIKGELVIRVHLELSEDIIKTWESIFIEVNGILVPFFVVQIDKKSDIDLQIKLEDIDDEKQAKIYQGATVFIDKKDYQEAEEKEAFFEWIGYKVRDVEGLLIGTFTDLLEYPAQNMLKIITDENEEIIIPAIEDWIVSEDTENKEVVINLPDGLIDLNRPKDIFA